MSALPVNQILLGPCEESLKTLPDNSIDSIVTDIPYGLGTREPTAEEIGHYLRGESLDTGGDFMGKEWSIPSVPVWKECYRVLKPGAHLFSFGGTRTWDIISIGIRAAGFENRDTLASEFGVSALQWLHASGFPKSKNISKALTKLGVPEEVIKQWEGYGTALKPAWEPILVFRKPLEEKTLDKQVLETGTGALNIDGCRVAFASEEDKESAKPGSMPSSYDGFEGKSFKTRDRSSEDPSDYQNSKGRYPSNVVFVHADGCKLTGTKVVKGDPRSGGEGTRPGGFANVGSDSGNGKPCGKLYGDQEVEVWECAEGCPVKALDEQSGVLTSGTGAVTKATSSGYRPNSYGADNRAEGTAHICYGDSGGASRYYPQFEAPSAPFFYTGKASRRERNKGVTTGTFKDGFVELRSDLTEAEQDKLVREWPSDNPSPKTVLMEELVPEGLRSLFQEVKPEDNKHPTVKPVKLMQWLVRLATPKGGIVLDPYCGSGTTCAAAVEENCNFIGMDKDPVYVKLAKKRVGYLKAEMDSMRQQQSVFDLMDELEQE